MLATSIKSKSVVLGQNFGHLIKKKNQPHIPLFIEGKNLALKTANTNQEKLQVYKLRYEVFLADLKKNKKVIQFAPEVDMDYFDLYADHLIIIDQATNKIIGTYRVLCSKFIETFYSQSEFKLNHFLKSPETKIELSRACIHPEYRNGAVISLLWRGIYQYLVKSEADLLFGMSSIFANNPKKIASVIHNFKEKNVFLSDSGIFPKRKKDRSQEILAALNESAPPKTAKSLIPPLLRTYLHAGAKIVPVPAYDKKFHCFDFLTILEKKHLNPSFIKRFS